MNKILFSFMALVIVLATSCNQSSNRNSQPSFDPGGRQGNFDPEAMANRQVEQLKETLNLSSDQQKQMHDIMIESSENMRKMRDQMQNDGGGFEGMREQMQQIREEQNKKIKAILSDAQWEKYETYQEEIRARRRQDGQGRPGKN
jgi:periplasmic protein CpxP/Spy